MDLKRFFLNCIGMLPVLFLFAIISWAYFSYVIILQIPLFSEKPIKTGFTLLFFHIILFFFLVSYIQTVITNPGEIPDDFPEKYGDVILECTDEGVPRECTKCQKKKPDRSHHCSICRNCTLKMDHHCPWVNNCVGFRNYKFFILFLTYTVILCLYVCLTTLPWILDNGFTKKIGGYNIQIVMVFFVTAVFSFGLLMFSLQHYRLVFANKTTIESMERNSSIRWKDASSISNHNLNDLYDLGWKNNFCQVFGSSPWLWFVPVSSSIGNGLSFPTKTENRRLLEV